MIYSNISLLYLYLSRYLDIKVDIHLYFIECTQSFLFYFIWPIAFQIVCSCFVRKSVSTILVTSTMLPVYRRRVWPISCKITAVVIQYGCMYWRCLFTTLMVWLLTLLCLYYSKHKCNGTNNQATGTSILPCYVQLLGRVHWCWVRIKNIVLCVWSYVRQKEHLSS